MPVLIEDNTLVRVVVKVGEEVQGATRPRVADDLAVSATQLRRAVERYQCCSGLDLVFGQVISWDITELVATIKELAQQWVGDMLEGLIRIALTKCAFQRALCASTGSGFACDTRPSLILSLRSGLVIVRTN